MNLVKEIQKIFECDVSSAEAIVESLRRDSSTALINFTPSQISEGYKLVKSSFNKAVGHAIHEHNSGLGTLYRNIDFIKERRGQEKMEEEELITRLTTCREAAKKCQESVDYLYKEMKERKML